MPPNAKSRRSRKRQEATGARKITDEALDRGRAQKRGPGRPCKPDVDEAIAQLYELVKQPAPAEDPLQLEEWISGILARCVYLAQLDLGGQHNTEVRRLAEIVKRAAFAAGTAIAQGITWADVPPTATPPLASPGHNAIWVYRAGVAELERLLRGSTHYEHLKSFREAIKASADLGYPSAALLGLVRNLKAIKSAQQREESSPELAPPPPRGPDI